MTTSLGLSTSGRVGVRVNTQENTTRKLGLMQLTRLVRKPTNRIDKYRKGEREEKDGVHECGKNLGAVPAIGIPRVGIVVRCAFGELGKRGD